MARANQVVVKCTDCESIYEVDEEVARLARGAYTCRFCEESVHPPQELNSDEPDEVLA